MATRCAYGHLDGEDLVVTVEASVKLNLNIKIDPDLIAILRVKLDGANGKEKVDVDANTIIEVSENVAILMPSMLTLMPTSKVLVSM